MIYEFDYHTHQEIMNGKPGLLNFNGTCLVHDTYSNLAILRHPEGFLLRESSGRQPHRHL